MSYQYLEIKKNDHGVVHLYLNRPEIHNAFDEVLISEITNFFTLAKDDATIEMVVLGGNGRSFCAGADLNWMKKMVNYSAEENLADSKKLASMLQTMNDFPKPLIARVNGAVMGGGVGLVSTCDYVVAVERSFFALSEVKLGILPAVISPFVIRKIGESAARATFLSGSRFSAHKAEIYGLVHEVVSDEAALDDAIDKYINELRSAGPRARLMAKDLIKALTSPNKTQDELVDMACHLISEVRISEEGQAGMNALLNKEKAPWAK